MDLRSERPYWPSTCRRPRLRSSLSRRGRVDVLIVGAGVTGALVAYALAKAGARVAVVDNRAAGSGSTPASTALLQYEIDTPLVKLSAALGRAHAEAAYKASRGALDDIVRIDRELGGGIDLLPRRSLQLAVKPSDVRTLRAEVAARQRLSFPVSMLSRAALRSKFSLNRPGAILSEEALEVNPLKLTYRLLSAAKERGVCILPRTRLNLSTLATKTRPFRVELPDGGRVVADRVVMATGYETPEQFREIAVVTELRSTFALATEPLSREPWPERALLWDAGDPYFYARTTADLRVMIGGEDEPFTTAAARDAMLASKTRTLMKNLRDLVPRLRFQCAFCWAGTFASTKDGLPYIGEHHRFPGVSFALGYGGNGITFSVIAADIIAAAFGGSIHPAAKLFTFDR